jgi:hypothetical protein
MLAFCGTGAGRGSSQRTQPGVLPAWAPDHPGPPTPAGHSLLLFPEKPQGPQAPRLKSNQ